ncbi:acyltransferase family protein [Novosphingobium kaempferiae]|uniref:acyltransferase family protein n=1 Tax=Novosphingobium kaempferiae TaxID=2896849 RepID=UPI001E3FF252|nr:acyltransferase [Novosphingobium kaempferiae]
MSVFLDLLRLFAALLVLVGHAGEVYKMHLPAMLGHSAKEGVAIFFVLSGFVIAFVTQHKERDWRSFAKARALRMYSVVPLALVVMLVCYAIIVTLAPRVYGVGGHVSSGAVIGEAPGWWGMLRYLTFTNEIWFNRSLVSTGAPFWSLGFEVAYYVGFAALFYVRGHWRWALVLVWALACGPRIVLAFPLWLIGVAAWAAVQKGFAIRPVPGAVALVLIGLLAFAWRRWCAIVAMPLFEWGEPAAMAASMGYYLGLCVLTGAAIVVFSAAAGDRPIWPGRVEALVRYCAGASFTLYIAHLPVMVLIVAIWPASVGSLTRGFAATALTVMLMFCLAEIGERRKNVYQRFFSRVSMIRFSGNNNSISAID